MTGGHRYLSIGFHPQLYVKNSTNKKLKVKKLVGILKVLELLVQLLIKHARKGFRSPSAMKGVGYFQNLRIFWKFWGIFWKNFMRIFLEKFIWRNFLGESFWEDFLGGFFWEDFFGRIILGGFSCLHC